MKPHGLVLSVVLLAAVVTPACGELTVKPSDAGAVVEVDGELFAEYLTRSGHQPAIWPLVGPQGNRLTRSYPLGERGADERDDHPHHRSLWFAHGIVNDADFWLEPKGDDGCLIKHEGFETLESDGQVATIVTRNDWLAGGESQCTDRRSFCFSAPESGVRLIDCTIELIAGDQPVTFGDTKEGAFAVRVAGTMKVDAKQGGHIVNSAGQQDSEAWGRAANWVDYSGPADGKQSGIAIFSCPDSDHDPCLWHVRTYGLFAANPFGVRHFPASDLAPQGPVTLQPGGSFKLRYLVVLHDGQRSQDQLAAMYERLTAK
ncbi:hypothetical protein Pla123a_22430 [Posidoniimonas polymericola]|uniref:Methane oxygenase PmoA n=1 Tax=Posidoniimonas polymericola TaxID=2528002 RepID=A0A5C5YPY8_9BACT|nr:PmoA family protein [Posidoniimonas polymericola]TWT76820.1 hypothetical protein Pla123a_22430 [Posidoniimonas polymericola]